MNTSTQPETLLTDFLKRGYRLETCVLLERIGLGGEAEIWTAWDEIDERVVVVKFMHLLSYDSVASAQTARNFERQTRLIANLNHPHILPIYTYGAVDDQFYFFVMRYASMGSLADLLLSGPLSLADTLELTVQIATALSFLHAHSLVHRDLKPSNILLDSQNRVFLSDFGLAKQLTAETMPIHTGRGTQAYAPFEQHNRLTVVPQSDVYSLGIVIFEMLTGKLPWEGTDNLASQQFQFDGQLPDLQDFDPSLPSALTLALRQLTAFHWAERPATAEAALELILRAAGKRKETFAGQALAVDEMADREAEAADARHLLRPFLANWQPTREEFPARLSHLALLSEVYRQDHHAFQEFDGWELFVLRGALAHGYEVDYWQQELSDSPQVWLACEQTLLLEGETAVSQALSLMSKLLTAETAPPALSAAAQARLVQIAASTAHATDQEKTLRILWHTLRPASGWRTVGIGVNEDEALAQMALSGQELAAQLIGKVGSETAVSTLLAAEANPQALNALSLAQSAAGGLPRQVPVAVRLRLRSQQMQQRLLRDNQNQIAARGIIGLIVGVVIFLLMLGGWFTQPSAQMRDSLLEPYPVSGIVTIVAVDDASLAAYGRWDSWPRSLHAALIDRLNAAGAGAIVFDFLFEAETPDDAVLQQAMEAAGNVVQPVLGFGDAIRDEPGEVRYEKFVLPQPALLEAGTAVGHTNILHDEDGYIRQLPMVAGVDGEQYPSLALSALRTYLDLGSAPLPSIERNKLTVLGREIPVLPFSEMIIYYAGPPEQPGESIFRMVSYQDVLEGNVPADVFKDKIVLVGMTATAEPDRYLTPVSNGRPMYGVEILANVIESIWSSHFISRPGYLVRLFILLGLGLLTGLLCDRPWSGLLIMLALGAAYFIAAVWLFDLSGLMLDILFPLLTILVSYVMVMAFRLSIEARRRREIMNKYQTQSLSEQA
ncbi:MAG: CHASE2 domain-containing protein [Ardenticatenaceae bacterium]|nr:CHASE2 domain-containing protein [Ardenticatenaceae bacterium]MCB8986861.1 CHASE2 domain-containing protein [Ardenticatenaceae bacterium]